MKKSFVSSLLVALCGFAVGETVDNPGLDELTSLESVSSNTERSSLVNSNAFTISFDVSNVTSTDGYLLSLSVCSDVNKPWRCASLQIVSGSLTLCGVGGTTVTTNLACDSLCNTTLTLTGKNSNNLAVLTLYSDGVQVAQTTTSGSATNWFEDNNGKATVFFGKLGDTSNSASAVYSNVYYSASTALTAAQVSSIVVNQSVPEPATASLSLLALGALALRRRRQ